MICDTDNPLPSKSTASTSKKNLRRSLVEEVRQHADAVQRQNLHGPAIRPLGEPSGVAGERARQGVIVRGVLHARARGGHDSGVLVATQTIQYRGHLP